MIGGLGLGLHRSLHHGLSLGLPMQGGIQRAHGSTNLLGVTTGIGRLQRLGGVQHGAVALAQCGFGLFTLDRLAVERIVNRFAKRVPQLLLVATVQRHRVRFGLPALLQMFDRIDVQHRRGTQHLGLFDHVAALLQAQRLQGFQRGGSRTDSGQPQRLQLGKCFLAQVTGFAPAVAKLMQDAVETLPVVVFGGGILRRPGLDLFNQRQALGLVFNRFGLDLFQPGFDHLVGLVAGFIKTLPQRVVGHAALIGLLPLLAQCAQAVLHLAPTDGLAFGALEQPFRLGDQFFAQLVGTPALPAFQFTGGGQRRVRLVFQLVVNQAAKFFQRVAQRSSRTGAGLAVAFSNLLL